MVGLLIKTGARTWDVEHGTVQEATLKQTKPHFRIQYFERKINLRGRTLVC